MYLCFKTIGELLLLPLLLGVPWYHFFAVNPYLDAPSHLSTELLQSLMLKNAMLLKYAKGMPHKFVELKLSQRELAVCKVKIFE